MSCNQPSDSRPIPDALLLAWQWQEERSNRSWVRSSRGAIIVPVDNAKYVVA
ncbi:hypothetical protein PGTUg99_033268 [Puccinia graminis f. sp. tritici]|uniref:Uncharacterized protein n=1 Tax=Puccinia graminis f. sp. tritici TaxID=56615 RepID=A0A5B0S7R7_PUCGR|nr:hypothetical protein PGTUg99_033268 [Puccinia graminis f. sp. tritici]